MFKLDTYIQIGDYEFDNSCVEIEIVNAVDSLTDTCKITIPRKFQWDGRHIALGDDPILKRKDKVIVKAGYDGNIETEFIGYIKNIKSGVPVTIECEDSMMLLKQSEHTRAYATGLVLRKLLTDILPTDVEFVCADTTLGDYRFSKVSAAQILEDLHKRYGLFSYFRLITEPGQETRPVLYVGFMYSTDHRMEADFEFGHNIIDGNDLVYKREEDVRLKVKVIGIKRNNVRHEEQVGDPDGELRTVHYYNTDNSLLKERAEKDLKRFKYTGYYGSFLTFGEPSIQKGDVAHMIGNQYHPDGKYLIKKVTKRIGVTSGYKQTIEPESIINSK
ncbi:MAG: hypothetical protein Q8K66_13105 [Sediminibacterium sp.]|nr:hypothetical protein [Sediminibacterium sp.]MDP3128827.1 hypothetical protein [Sediminibacterium sp.]